LRIIYGVAEHWVNRIRNKGNKGICTWGGYTCSCKKLKAINPFCNYRKFCAEKSTKKYSSCTTKHYY